MPSPYPDPQPLTLAPNPAGGAATLQGLRCRRLWPARAARGRVLLTLLTQLTQLTPLTMHTLLTALIALTPRTSLTLLTI